MGSDSNTAAAVPAFGTASITLGLDLLNTVAAALPLPLLLRGCSTTVVLLLLVLLLLVPPSSPPEFALTVSACTICSTAAA